MQRARAVVSKKLEPKLDSWYDEKSAIPDLDWQDYWTSATVLASKRGVRGRAKRAKFMSSSEAQVTIEMEAYDEGSEGSYTRFQVTYGGSGPGVYQTLKSHTSRK